MTFATPKEAIEQVEKAMRWSDPIALKERLPNVDFAHIKGLSSLPCREFLNVLCGKPGTRYLEVGTHTGSSLLAACWNNSLSRAVGIDNWSMDPNSKPKLFEQLETFKDYLKVKPEIIEGEAFGMDKSKLGEFDVYFYDGHHSADSQEKGLTCFFKSLARVAIVVVDDYSVFRVQQGTIRAIDKIGCKQHLRYAWTLPGGKGFEDLYWGGLAVMVFAK